MKIKTKRDISEKAKEKDNEAGRQINVGMDE